MKAEFVLNINDVTGEPVIYFKHHDKVNSVEQNLLKIFIDKAKEKGIEIVNPSGYVECGTNNSWENYVIKIKK